MPCYLTGSLEEATSDGSTTGLLEMPQALLEVTVLPALLALLSSAEAHPNLASLAEVA